MHCDFCIYFSVQSVIRMPTVLPFTSPFPFLPSNCAHLNLKKKILTPIILAVLFSALKLIIMVLFLNPFINPAGTSTGCYSRYLCQPH